MTNPDAQQDRIASEIAANGGSEAQIAGAAQGFATVYDASGPFGPPDGLTLPTLPELPTGYDWRVILREHDDSNNLTDRGEEWDGRENSYSAWYGEDGHRLFGHKVAIVFLRQNTVVLHQHRVQVEGRNTEFEFVSAIVRGAERLYSEHDFTRNTWLTTDFPGMQEN